MTLLDGLRLSITTLTVLPVRGGRVDRATAAVAMTAAPLVGTLLGGLLALLLWLLREAHAPTLVAAAVTVAAAALLTRGMHLDGLADTIDALGSYRRGDAALEIMKKPDIGPFGVAAIAATMLIQTATLTSLSATAVIIAWAAGRLAIPLACRRGVPAARPEGLGALVAGTVPLAAVIVAAVVIAAAGALAHPWHGPLAVALSISATLLLVHHCTRRFGGITGDVLGASVELSTTIALVALSLH
ncbi:adenosylcobinamide-GDP ribazoletransferase [Paractinoplanes atraurantiacus]|uniref:Adenosylcobinamide-GDP ribazoletransferase n=1 Tax=Paractinoplanes atraurantiacus TaxID=1036182 RepID=A0A285HC73_9ACTN|nr:adenosylcobinamide-GDP ribazoletransferase [Actinoplanes atraurantiacus]SNY33254.1 adenosylcobinamide-GDP ribazoletransferase [Actinoplanes atraurantiacus]